MTKLNRITRHAIERHAEQKKIKKSFRPWKRPNLRARTWQKAHGYSNSVSWADAWAVWDEEF